MYYYIFDIKKCKKKAQIDSIKTYLGSLGIAGEFTYPTAACNVEELVDLALQREYSTIVGIGDDEIANTIAGKLVGRKEAMGFIPLEITPAMAHLFNIESWKEACEALRFRKINEIRLGRTATGNHFLTYIYLGIKSPVEITLELKNYIVQAKVKNFAVANYHPGIKKVGDDFLDIMFTSVSDEPSSILNKFSSIFSTKKKEGDLEFSLIRGRSLRIFTKSPMPIISGNDMIAKTPQFIESTDESLRVITARKAGQN